MVKKVLGIVFILLVALVFCMMLSMPIMLNKIVPAFLGWWDDTKLFKKWGF